MGWRLMMGGEDGTTRVWIDDAGNTTLDNPIPGDHDGLLTYNPDGILYGGEDGTTQQRIVSIATIAGYPVASYVSRANGLTWMTVNPANGQWERSARLPFDTAGNNSTFIPLSLAGHFPGAAVVSDQPEKTNFVEGVILPATIMAIAGYGIAGAISDSGLLSSWAAEPTVAQVAAPAADWGSGLTAAGADELTAAASGVSLGAGAAPVAAPLWGSQLTASGADELVQAASGVPIGAGAGLLPAIVKGAVSFVKDVGAAVAPVAAKGLNAVLGAALAPTPMQQAMPTQAEPMPIDWKKWAPLALGAAGVGLVVYSMRK